MYSSLCLLKRKEEMIVLLTSGPPSNEEGKGGSLEPTAVPCSGTMRGGLAETSKLGTCDYGGPCGEDSDQLDRVRVKYTLMMIGVFCNRRVGRCYVLSRTWLCGMVRLFWMGGADGTVAADFLVVNPPVHGLSRFPTCRKCRLGLGSGFWEVTIFSCDMHR